jgi:hypothetical protein
LSGITRGVPLDGDFVEGFSDRSGGDTPQWTACITVGFTTFCDLSELSAASRALLDARSRAETSNTIEAESLFAELRYMPILRSVK